jgi:hypothetical protein
VLDGAQVKRIVQGEALEAAPPKPSAAAVVPEAPAAPVAAEVDRSAGLVSPPLPDPLPQ